MDKTELSCLDISWDSYLEIQVAAAKSDRIDTPVKGLYLFENSVRRLLFEKPGRAWQILPRDVLQQTNTLADEG